MLLQTNSYVVPKEKKSEHARMMRRFRQTLLRLGCEHFEVYEQVGANWSADESIQRFVQILRFVDRRHQLSVQAAERADPTAQAVIAEFCELINFPIQQEKGFFAVGYYTSVLPVSPRRDSRGEVVSTVDQEPVHEHNLGEDNLGEDTLGEHALDEHAISESAAHQAPSHLDAAGEMSPVDFGADEQMTGHPAGDHQAVDPVFHADSGAGHTTDADDAEFTEESGHSSAAIATGVAAVTGVAMYAATHADSASDIVDHEPALHAEELLAATGTVETGTVETSTVETSTVETSKVETGSVDTGKVEHSGFDAAPLEPDEFEIPPDSSALELESPAVHSTPGETSAVDTSAVTTSATDDDWLSSAETDAESAVDNKLSLDHLAESGETPTQSLLDHQAADHPAVENLDGMTDAIVEKQPSMAPPLLDDHGSIQDLHELPEVSSEETPTDAVLEADTILDCPEEISDQELIAMGIDPAAMRVAAGIASTPRPQFPPALELPDPGFEPFGDLPHDLSDENGSVDDDPNAPIARVSADELTPIDEPASEPMAGPGPQPIIGQHPPVEHNSWAEAVIEPPDDLKFEPLVEEGEIEPVAHENEEFPTAEKPVDRHPGLEPVATGEAGADELDDSLIKSDASPTESDDTLAESDDFLLDDESLWTESEPAGVAPMHNVRSETELPDHADPLPVPPPPLPTDAESVEFAKFLSSEQHSDGTLGEDFDIASLADPSAETMAGEHTDTNGLLEGELTAERWKHDAGHGAGNGHADGRADHASDGGRHEPVEHPRNW